MGKWPFKNRRLSRTDHALWASGVVLMGFGVGLVQSDLPAIGCTVVVLGVLLLAWGLVGRPDECKLLDARWVRLKQLARARPDDVSGDDGLVIAREVSVILGEHVGAVDQDNWDRYAERHRHELLEEPLPNGPTTFAQSLLGHLETVIKDIRSRQGP